MKICSKCKQEKLESKYSLDRGRHGLRSWCKECRAAYSAAYYTANRGKRAAYRIAHQEEIRVRDAAYYVVNSDKIKARNAAYYAVHRKEKAGYEAKRKREDLNYRLACELRVRLYHALKGGFKTGSAVRDLGCTIEELKTYLESKRQPGMTWENWNLRGWHLDHIIPLSSFDLTDHAQLCEACHYTNLQPLWAADNIRKHCKPGKTIKQLVLMP